MFLDDRKKKVDLRGQSKKADRQTLLAKAAREREERALQRRRLTAANILQASHRARVDMRRLRTSLRASFDAALPPPSASLPPTAEFAAQAPILCRNLLLFHQHCNQGDQGRRKTLLSLYLHSAASTDATINACVRLCATGADGIKRWAYQVRRLAELCLPHLLVASDSDRSADAAAAAAVPVELRFASYALDASEWQWKSLLPAAAATFDLPQLASTAALVLSRRGLYTHATAALDAILPPAAVQLSSALPISTSPLIAPLLALLVRGVHAVCAAPSMPLSTSPEPPVGFVARGLLCHPTALSRVPTPLLTLLFAPALEPLVRSLAMACTAEPGGGLARLLMSSRETGPSASPVGSLPASIEALLLLKEAHMCANLALLATVCSRADQAGSSLAVSLGDAVPEYIGLLHACRSAVAHALARPRSKKRALPASPPRAMAAVTAAAGSSSDENEDGDGLAPVPMEVEQDAACSVDGISATRISAASASPDDASAEEWDALSDRLRLLAAPEHISTLWLATLAPAASPRLVQCAPQLAIVMCELLYGDSAGSSSGGASEGRQPHARAAAALSALAFNSDAVCRLWVLAASQQADWASDGGGALLSCFCSCFSHLLVAVDDEEFFAGRPFPAATLRPMVQALKVAALATYWPSAAHGILSRPPPTLASALLRLLRQLYDRDMRRSFMGGPQAWFADAARQQTIESLAQRMDPAVLDAVQAEPPPAHETAAAATSALGGLPSAMGFGIFGDLGGGNGGGLPLSELPEARRVASLLLRMPFTLAFESRLRVLRRWLAADREERLSAMLIGQTPYTITVRREHLLTDAHQALRGMGLQLRSPLRVRFLGLDDMEEAGIGEGVAKEFLVDVLKAGLDPALGLFSCTSDGCLYPNPAAPLRVSDAYSLFEFLGAILAKTLYEGILVDLPFASFFVSRLLGRTNTVADLPSMDDKLYESLMFVKRYDGAPEGLEALTLSFAVEQFTDEALPFTARRQVSLKPNGADTPVTMANRLEYIFLVSHFRLNTQMRRPCDAFLRGFGSVVPLPWVNMFSPAELQLVLGGSDAPLDVDDWRANAVFSGGYHTEHPVIRMLWQVLREYDAPKRAATLKFATSCSRPPLLGFAHLQPRFCVHMATDEEGRLPTAATCMNLLKLPPYENVETLRERLTYAIEAGCGFELS